MNMVINGFKGFICILFSLLVNETLTRRNSQVPFKVTLNEQGQFLDNFGRIRMFHGINSVMKGFPWFDNQILNATRLKLYKEWGFNIVRLGCMWSGWQPTESGYNVTYINILRQIVHQLEYFGMYSLLDMHQDVLSSKFGAYDGIPLWLVEKFPSVPNEFSFPFPLKNNTDHFWVDYYFTYAASEAFQNLYSTEIGLTNWENIWGKIASIFVKEVSVIGYELLNEPWFGNFYTDPRRILPGYAGRQNLLPAYDRLVGKIREFDNETLVFYEPVTMGSYLPTVGDGGTGFDRVPGGASQKLRSVMSYHFYCFLIATTDPAKDYPKWMRIVCDKVFGKQLFSSVVKNMNITGGGSLLTEFGLCVPDGSNTSINTLECEAVLQLADQHYQSFTYWDSEFFNDDGNVKSSAVKTFARSYPRAVQGQPLNYTFNTTNGIIEFSYIININIKAPTEIFLPISVHYSLGFENETHPTMKTNFDKLNSLFLVFSPSGIRQGTKVSLKIFPYNKYFD